MAGYVLHHYNVIDRSRVDELGPLSLVIAEKYGAEVIVASPVKVLKGKTKYSNMVIYKLKSFEAAPEFCHSPEMVEFAVLRDQIVNGFAMVLPGFSETEKAINSGYFRS